MANLQKGKKIESGLSLAALVAFIVCSCMYSYIVTVTCGLIFPLRET